MSSIETKVLEEIRKLLIVGIAIMDEKGRRNPEGNSEMLWLRDWNEVRLHMYNSVELCDEIIQENW